ncbi:ATP-binding protein [Bifidobacterium miconisargentati]|uniref:ATP-binding protein n=1 Tax=Bifidobacterium miconisargentati TaxID=2834437 RepID=UPI001BDBE5F7|nr:ATP-binding protein [Bifidobacterium miconisargentati]MBW3090146.1 ATP-binding protein [Bifidobacterium miconisargentati]
MIGRPQYLQKLDAWKDRYVVKVITGVRRCGKSTLMLLWKQRLIEHYGVAPESIVHINLELLENEPLLEYHHLYEEILRRCGARSGTSFGLTTGRYYVLIDEIQNVPDFQKTLDSLQARGDIDLYITGSNAMLLSGTLATLISGRSMEISMTPLSFAEYWSARAGDGLSMQRAWSEYLHDGALPATVGFSGDETMLHDYLDGILNTVLFKDVAARLGVSNIAALETVTRYLFDNVGNLVNPKSIADAMTSMGTKISSPTVSNYLEGLVAAFIFYPVQRYDVKGKRALRQERKYYAVDLGIRRVLCSNKVRDTGRLLENVVFLELMRREGDVYVGQGAGGEIDFITNGAGGPRYYQVSESVHDPNTLERELSSLRAVRDNYPKMLITLDDERPISHEGIQQIYALDWLLSNEREA